MDIFWQTFGLITGIAGLWSWGRSELGSGKSRSAFVLFLTAALLGIIGDVVIASATSPTLWRNVTAFVFAGGVAVVSLRFVDEVKRSPEQKPAVRIEESSKSKSTTEARLFIDIQVDSLPAEALNWLDVVQVNLVYPETKVGETVDVAKIRSFQAKQLEGLKYTHGAQMDLSNVPMPREAYVCKLENSGSELINYIEIPLVINVLIPEHGIPVPDDIVPVSTVFKKSVRLNPGGVNTLVFYITNESFHRIKLETPRLAIVTTEHEERKEVKLDHLSDLTSKLNAVRF